ncbi:MAG: glucoamylase family protein [Acidobacteriaceae bacterium]
MNETRCLRDGMRGRTGWGRLSRRDLLGLMGRGLALAPWAGLGLAGCGGGSSGGSGTGGSSGGSGLTDDQLLDAIEQGAFQFFWTEADPSTGLIKDRALAAGGDTSTLASIASTGFGLTGLCIGDSRGYAPSAQIESRVLTTLEFLWNTMPNQNGFFYHFVDMTTGARAGTSEVSSMDTAILLCGVLTCRQHFSSNAQIVSYATQIYERVNWAWMLNGGTTLSMGWLPESGFLTYRWDTYAEEMMLYLLAMASPTYPIAASSWDAFARPVVTYEGLTYIAGAPTLFIHQYSHAWFDFRNKADAYANYFQNSVTATKAHVLFCESLASQFSDYSAELWGITASDSVKGYVAWGGPPVTGPIDGTVVPCAAGGSVVFDAAACLTVLHTMKQQYGMAWQLYGFVDAFNPLTGWYDVDSLGIDQGIMMLMAENQRSGFVWSTFMKNPEANTALQLAGFQSTV